MTKSTPQTGYPFNKTPIPLPRITDPAVKRRFARKLLIVGPGSVKGCWLWRGAKSGDGYGKFKYEGHVIQAHRVSYAIYRGEIPENMTVHHTYTPEGYDSPLPHDVNPENLDLLLHGANTAESNGRGGHRGAVKKQMLQRVENNTVEAFLCPRCAGTMVKGKRYVCLNCDYSLTEREATTVEDRIAEQ